ncbi:protease IV [Nitratiruptor phage NrS-5]|uniref:S49 family peptidase n=1 Tax=unclassified Nitratiruptor TaxID=2624044 RepID=UPI0019164E1F|nr:MULTISPECIES: S49 family peptidase [unclassified Nitratiruptor]BCD61744.1 protease IV [Nitratiruptor sp. YY08-13]BCD65679.1 protease IV [Nitratiruptor sp. YY08-26]BCD83222.1 protease IV [Nitratiruptor phage NrS-4]BCD83281.1 protease IV [Nitratiruptor phage NrS-5]
MKANRVFKYLTTNEFAILKDKYELMLSIASDGAQISQEEIDRFSSSNNTVRIEDGVGIVTIEGPLVKKGNMFTKVSGLTSYQQLANDFKQLEETKEVHTIVAHITSPGGEVAGVSALGDVIASIDKKTVAYIDDLGASAAYWLASQFDEIYANETALIGSIGVIAAYSKDDSTVKVVSSNAPYKYVDPETDEGYKKIQERLTSIESIFIDKVAKGRGVDRDIVLSNFGQGDVLIASKALEVGMIDGIKPFGELIQNIKGEKMKNIKQLAQDPNANAEALAKFFSENGIPNPYELSAKLNEVEKTLSESKEKIEELTAENKKLKANSDKALIAAFCGANREYVTFAEEKRFLEEGKTFAEVQAYAMKKAEQESTPHDTHTGKEGDGDAVTAAFEEAIKKINARR